MIAEFTHTLTIGDEDVDVLVEYSAIRCFGEVDIEVLSVTLDGQEVLTLPDQDKDILDACFDRVDDDLQADADSEGDYRYDQSRDYND